MSFVSSRSSRSSFVICTLFLSSASPPHHPNRVWSGAARSHWVLSLASVASCIVLILLVHVAWSRCMIRWFQFQILQYIPDVPLISLDRDALPNPLEDTIQDSSSLLVVRILMKSSTADRSPPIVMSYPCTVDTKNSPLTQPCHAHGHATPLVNLRWLSVGGSSSSQFCAASRAPYKLYCNNPHMCSSITCRVIFWQQPDEYSSS